MKTQLAVLSRREKQVLALMAQGLENHAIAAQLGITNYTLTNHTHSIYQRLGIADAPGINQRVKAVLVYLEEA